MSGLCGVMGWGGRGIEAPALEPMLEAAAHRGPDGRGVWCAGAVGLGHLALRITPESVGERQPLASADGEVVLVADARIDNRADLLRRLGLPGNGRSAAVTDAALILAAYRRWGVECAAELVGDFAFALWDARERRLFAARDPLGMRAFYYRVEPERVLFATEIKQILAVPGVPVELFEPMVGAYLAGGFGPAEWTFYAGIQQLAPAHALVVSAAGQRSWRYWDIDPGKRIRYRSDEEYAEHFRELFKEAVRARLRSVKPVGLLLSGGLDSGSIAATAGWLLANEPGVSVPEFRAYSWAFEELTECDERHISGEIAAHYGFPVTAVPADDAWPLRGYPDNGPDRDEPYFNFYQFLNDRTIATARAEGVGLILTGHRGDEMVGDWVFDFPGLLKSFQWRSLATDFRAYQRRNGSSALRTFRREIARPLLHALGREHRWSPTLPPWLGVDFSRRIELPALVDRGRAVPPVRGWARQQRYTRIFRVGGARHACSVDRFASGHALEWTDPWADRRIAEFVLAIPQDLVNRPSEPKRLARRYLAPFFPPATVGATKKIIPEALDELGFRYRERNTVGSLIAGSRSGRRGYVDESVLLGEYEHYVRTGELTSYLWWPLTLEAWLARHWSDRI